MRSVFDLKTDANELSSANQGTAKLQYRQVPCIRDVSGQNFTGGALNFRWECGGNSWWIPSRSYIRMRAKLTKANGDPLTLADGIAPNLDLCPNLFQSGEFRIQDKTVSRIGDFFAQVDVIEARQTKSRSWIKSVGYSTHFLQDSFADRLNLVSADGCVAGDQSYGLSEVNAGIVGSGIAGDSTLGTTAAAADSDVLFRFCFFLVGDRS